MLYPTARRLLYDAHRVLRQHDLPSSEDVGRETLRLLAEIKKFLDETPYEDPDESANGT